MTRKDLKAVLRDTLHPMGPVHDGFDDLQRVIDEVWCESVEAAKHEAPPEPVRQTVPPTESHDA